ncbi:MAG: hypothetical protein NZ824_12255 [Candidatus Thioglobus sp.]|nr:hypothetical protein [Candidatus Thioglobus sp.]
MSEDMATEVTDNVEAPVLSDNQDWKEGLSEELRADPSLANVKDLESAAKTLVHQQKMLGSRIPLPKTDEERQELFTKLGRPENAADYEVTPPEGYGQYYPEEMIGSFKEAGHQLGLSPEQMQGLMDWQKTSIDYQLNQEQSSADQNGVQTEEILREEFGANYDKQLTAAQRALKVYGNKDLQNKLADPRYGNDPDLIKLLAAAGKDITEDSARGTANNSLVMSPMDARMQIDAIQSNANHAYWNPRDLKHGEAQLEMQQLYAKANPEE